MNRTNNLATLLMVARKEWLDFFRDRRTFYLSLLMMPLLYPLLFLGIGKLTQMRAETQLEKTLSVPVVGMERAPNLMKFLASYGIDAKPAPADIEARVRAQQEDLALAIDADFAKDWHDGKPAKIDIITDTTRRNGDVKVARVSKVLESYGNGVGAMRLLIRGINPGIATPLHVGTRDMATPEAKNSQFMSILLPMILTIFAFIGGAHLAMDTTAGERERQSLEPLLATPASRAALVGGKMLAAALLGMISMLLILVAFKLTATLATGMAKQMDVSFLAMGKLHVRLIPLVLVLGPLAMAWYWPLLGLVAAEGASPTTTVSPGLSSPPRTSVLRLSVMPICT